MGITERHVQYLEWVSQGRITISGSQYKSVSWANGHIFVDQLVAVHSELMGLTHIVSTDGGVLVALTSHGASILNDEVEAWG